jgi:hypothetical protein
MADVHWAVRYAVDGMFIREMLLRERNEVTDECMRDRRILCSLQAFVGALPVGVVCGRAM